MSKSALFFSRNSLIFFILFCILSRFFTSIFYIEDIASLRFALSISDYDVLSNRPHFPGYPLFCFILGIIYSVINIEAYCFSIIGGASNNDFVYSFKLSFAI